MSCGDDVRTLLKNIFEPDEVLAEETGFYFVEYDADGNLDFKKHADIISHWQPLVAPNYRED